MIDLEEIIDCISSPLKNQKTVKNNIRMTGHFPVSYVCSLWPSEDKQGHGRVCGEFSGPMYRDGG